MGYMVASSYSLSLVNMFVSAGLLLLTTSFYKSYARSWSNEDKSAATDDDETEPLHPVTSPVSPCSIEHAHSTFVGEEQEPWNPPFKAYRWAVLLFLVSNVFLVVVPFVPPSSEQGRVYRRLPYWVRLSPFRTSPTNHLTFDSNRTDTPRRLVRRVSHRSDLLVFLGEMGAEEEGV